MAETQKEDLKVQVEIGHYLAPEITSSSPKHAVLEPPDLVRLTSTMIADFQDCDTKVEEGLFSVAWAPDNKQIATATGDGNIIVIKPNGTVDKVLHSSNAPSKLPVTALQFRPVSKLLKTEAVLVSGNTIGDIEYWHVPTGKRISAIHEEDNEIYTIDYRPDGKKLATAGKDMCVRIYDEVTKRLESKFEQGVLHARGHSNRIFSSKWHRTDPNILFTASWDRTVCCWDRREGRCVKSFFGPYVCGEGLCVTEDDTLVTGSWRKEDTIEEWDIGTGLRLKSLNWKSTPMVYCMKPHPKRKGIFAVAGTGYNILRIFDINSELRTEPVHLADNKGIYSLDFDAEGDFIAYCGDSNILSMKRICLPWEADAETVAKSDVYA